MPHTKNSFIILALLPGSSLFVIWYARVAMRPLNGWFRIVLAIAAASSAFGAAFGATADSRLIDAARQSDVKTVRSLLAQHVDVNAKDVDGSTPLHWAAQRDSVE